MFFPWLHITYTICGKQQEDDLQTDLFTTVCIYRHKCEEMHLYCRIHKDLCINLLNGYLYRKLCMNLSSKCLKQICKSTYTHRYECTNKPGTAGISPPLIRPTSLTGRSPAVSSTTGDITPLHSDSADHKTPVLDKWQKQTSHMQIHCWAICYYSLSTLLLLFFCTLCIICSNLTVLTSILISEAPNVAVKGNSYKLWSRLLHKLVINTSPHSRGCHSDIPSYINRYQHWKQW